MKARGTHPAVSPVATLAAIAALSPAASAGLILEERLTLRCDLLRVDDGRTETVDRLRIEARSGEVGRSTRVVHWPSPDAATGLDLEVRGVLPDEGDVLPVQVDAVVRPRGEAPVRASRTLPMTEGSSSLIDLYAIDRTRLVMSCTAERGEHPVVEKYPTFGRPVRFVVEVEWVDGERSVPLETNELNTLVGESVEYYFSFRGPGDPETMSLLLTPTRVTDDVVQVVAEVSGTLPGDGGPLLASRRQELVASRDATSAVAVVSGTPPTGYRFRITPHF